VSELAILGQGITDERPLIMGQGCGKIILKSRKQWGKSVIFNLPSYIKIGRPKEVWLSGWLRHWY
jgi:hypothetical protein